MNAFVAAVVSAALAAIATYFTSRRDLQLRFDGSLRDLRIEAYKILWKDLAKLAKYGRGDPLSKADAQALRGTLTTWYFETGGLVLSTQTRHDYFRLLDGLEVVIAGSGASLTVEDDEYLRVLGSRLRTGMTRDVGTRRTFVFRGDAERDGGQLAAHSSFVSTAGTARLTRSPRRGVRGARDVRLELPYAATHVDWDAARRELVVRAAPDGQAAEERLFLIEDDELVEGPKGWRRGESGPRRPSVIWERDDGATPGE